MMKKAAVIENANGGDKRCTNQDACDLGSGRSLKCKQDGYDDRGIHSQPAEKWNRRVMHLSWPWQVHHAHTQRKGTHRNDQHHGSEQSDEESEQACGHATPFHTENKI